MLQCIAVLPAQLRRGFKFLGLAFEGTTDRFELIGQLEDYNALRQAKVFAGFAAQRNRQLRRLLTVRGRPANSLRPERP